MKSCQYFFITEIIAISIISSFVFVDPILHPDPKLYEGLANNILTGTGYIDNIRNDFILPPVGHPIFIAFFKTLGGENGILFSQLAIFLGLVFFYFSLRSLNIPVYLSLILTLIFSINLPPISNFSIESSIFFTTSLLIFGIINYKKILKPRYLIIGILILLINVLVRPVLMPFIIVFSIVLFIILYKQKSLYLKNSILLIGGFGLSIFFLTIISNTKYGDKRLVSGTYSAIPLYSGFNNYIDLEKNYYSTNWKRIPDSLRIEGVKPYELKNTWQERDALLKKEVLSFIIEYPDKAYNAYMFRLNKFTFQADLSFYKFLMNLLIIGIFLIILLSLLKRNLIVDFPLAILLAITIYMVLILSVFPYSGERYYISIYPYLFISIVSLGNIFIKNFSIKSISTLS